MTRQENERNAVMSIQRYLRQLSYFDPDLTPPPIDGIYGEDTAAAVREFQRKNGLEPTGIVDRETWDRIYFEYLLSVAEQEAPVQIGIFPRIPTDYAISPGESWFLVELLQFMLAELGRDYDEIEGLERTGVYDDDTEAAVREFQARNILPVTGTVDKQTWNAIVRQYNKTAQNFTE